MSISYRGQTDNRLGILEKCLDINGFTRNEQDNLSTKLLQLMADEKFDQILEETNFSNNQATLNLRAVVLMRSGRPAEAANILRRMVISPLSLQFRPGVPLFTKSNLATALFMSGNVTGCFDVIKELSNDTDSQLILLRRDIADWEKSLSRIHWLDWKLCKITHIKGQLKVSFVPGKINDYN